MLSGFLPLSPSISLSPSLTHTFTHTHTLSLSFSFSLSLCLSLSLSLARSPSLFLSFSPVSVYFGYTYCLVHSIRPHTSHRTSPQREAGEPECACTSIVV